MFDTVNGAMRPRKIIKIFKGEYFLYNGHLYSMNVFLTSIMHQDTAYDFALIEASFELTARSVCSQIDQNFLFVVVCCSIPNISFAHENIIYHVVDYPAADKLGDTISKRLDKATKLISGLVLIKQYSPKYVFFIDADDWISSNLNNFLNSKAHCVGWYLSSGFIVDLNTKKYQFKHGLNRFSGSTFAIDYVMLIDKLNLAPAITKATSKDTIIKLVSKKILLDVINSHGYLKFLATFGLKCNKIPFPALAWVRNTGNNILSDGSIENGLTITRALLQKFGVEKQIKVTETNDNFRVRLFNCLLSFISYVGSQISSIR